MSDADPGAVARADLVIVGGPTHMRGMSSGMTRKMAVSMEQKKEEEEAGGHVGHGLEPDATGPGLRDWLHTLPKAPKGKPAAAFDTRGEGAMMGGAAKGIAHRLESHGYELVAGPEGFLIEGEDQLLRDGERARARAWAAGLIPSTTGSAAAP